MTAGLYVYIEGRQNAVNNVARVESWRKKRVAVAGCVGLVVMSTDAWLLLGIHTSHEMVDKETFYGTGVFYDIN